MISITAAAAEQIKTSAMQSKASGLALRVAAKRDAQGNIEYTMGFDDKVTAEDEKTVVEDVEIVVSALSKALLDGTVIDFVELEDSGHQFIFVNPNDPAQQSPFGASS